MVVCVFPLDGVFFEAVVASVACLNLGLRGTAGMHSLTIVVGGQVKCSHPDAFCLTVSSGLRFDHTHADKKTLARTRPVYPRRERYSLLQPHYIEGHLP